jgi:hypothetical protein
MKKPYHPHNKDIDHEIYILLTAKIRAEGLPRSEYNRILDNLRSEDFFRRMDEVEKRKYKSTNK